MDIEKPVTKSKKKPLILEEYSEADLNPNPEGGYQEEEDEGHHGGGQRQEVKCAQQ